MFVSTENWSTLPPPPILRPAWEGGTATQGVREFEHPGGDPPRVLVPPPYNAVQEVPVSPLLTRWFITVLALVAAAWLVPGITVHGTAWVAYAVMAVVLGLVNAVIRPLLKLLTCPLIVLTLGLFTLVINAVVLLLAARISTAVGVGFTVTGFWPAFWGALIVSVVTTVLSVTADEDRRR